MNASGQTLVTVAQQPLLIALADPQAIAGALPHVTHFEILEREHLRGFVAAFTPMLSIGPIPLQSEWWPAFTGHADVAYDIELTYEEHSASIGLALSLTPHHDRTAVAYSVDAHFRGPLRAVGQRVLGAVVSQQIQIALETIEKLHLATCEH